MPEQTIRVIDRVAERGDRSRLIDQAVRDYVRRRTRRALRKQLKEGALAQADFDLQLAREWFPLEKEAWHRRGE